MPKNEKELSEEEILEIRLMVGAYTTRLAAQDRNPDITPSLSPDTIQEMKRRLIEFERLSPGFVIRNPQERELSRNVLLTELATLRTEPIFRRIGSPDELVSYAAALINGYLFETSAELDSMSPDFLRRETEFVETFVLGRIVKPLKSRS